MPLFRKPGFAIAAAGIALLFGSSPASAAMCGDYNGDGSVTASDALGVLQAAIGIETCEMYRCDLDGSGGISATDALMALQSAVGQNVQTDCPAEQCVEDLDFFFSRIWTPILTDCVSCHNADGPASFTDHVLLPSSEPGYLEYNFAVLRDFAAITQGKIGRDLLLSKPLGTSHGGGRRLEMTTESPLYEDLLELLNRFDDPIPDCGGPFVDFYDGVGFLDGPGVLHKAALLFAGRPPTDAETAAVTGGSESVLRSTIRSYMTGPAFRDFLVEASNDRLLTDKFIDSSTSAFNLLGSDYEYPALYERLDEIEQSMGPDARWDAWVRTNRALSREPLQLIVNVVEKERPYTEVLTAEYFMVNPFSAVPYQAGVSFNDDWDDDEWREGTNQGYRLPGYPHSGILTSPMFLGRFPSTSTNRNRARSRWAHYFFLGVDIEGLAPRIVDPSALGDADNPTMNNVHCTVCHTVMDPVAGTFQNFGDNGRFRQYDTDSLPWTYKATELYQSGDLWYRDMREPGFNNVVMPKSSDDASVRWLSHQIITDPRFPRATAAFWFPGVFGRPPAVQPVDSSAADYDARLAAWVADDEELDRIGLAFRDGTAGTGSNGAYNLKDMLVEMVLSPLFTAQTVAGGGADRPLELADLGSARLLTPEALNRKFESTTGYRWALPWNLENPELLGRFRFYYGGIDSDGVTERTTELNALMSTVVQRMSLESACPAALTDFARTPAERFLFPHVEPGDRPDDATGAGRIRDNIVYLHRRLLGEDLAPNDPEIERTFQLFNQVRLNRIVQNKSTYLPWGSGYCTVDFETGLYHEQDPDHTIRSWVAVLVYLLSDYAFLYQ